MTTPQTPTAAGAVHDSRTVRALLGTLDAALDGSRRERLAADRAAVAADPTALDSRFPSAGRVYGRLPLPERALPDRAGWAVEDAVRAALLLSLAPERTAAEAARRYAQGDAGERRGVLLSLPYLPIGDAATVLTDDALRTNDARLITAALGPYARAHLDQHRWRHAVLKCLFSGIPLTAVAGLHARKDAELSRMTQAFADERRAAGRPVPADAALLVPAG
ncbi:MULTISPECIES: EboA domain-containing protein [unclassified Streptomyces]|uniref:EboA domain-containing protein n=1 Tax=unclassified Streptomyces TaxID=2593676 RepID=UPI0033E2A8B6